MVSARTAVTMAFVMDGAVYGSWAARVPALAEQVGTGPAGLGLALVGPAAAMVLTASPAGWACARWGTRRTLVVCLAAACLVLPLLGVAGSVWALGLALAVLGGLMGAVDVAVNVAAVTVVRTLGRPLMPVFHAGFSFGGLAGALGAALAAALTIAPFGQFCTVGAVGIAAVAVFARSVPGAPAAARERQSAPSRRWRDVVTLPRLWLLTGVALCAAVAEGACAEWSAVYLVDENAASHADGAVAYSVFTLAVALVRLTGERVEHRFGPYRVLASGGLIAAAGLLLVVSSPFGAIDYAGFAVAGLGLALCFPIAMGLAGDAGRQTSGSGGERELGFVTTVAYAGLLGGPPLIGAVAGVSGMAVAMGMVGVIALLITPAAIAAQVTGTRRPDTAAPSGGPEYAQGPESAVPAAASSPGAAAGRSS